MDFQNFTQLRVSTIEHAGSIGFDVIVETPHRGRVVIDSQRLHHPFLFGSTTQTGKGGNEIISEIVRLEEEAKDFLLKKWLGSPDV